MRVAGLGLYLAALAVGVVFDVRCRRVPNWLVVLLLMLSAVGAVSGFSPVVSRADAAQGVLMGLGLWLPFWLMGLLGAGDVKFFAAASGWIGVALTWRAALLAAVLGGVMSLIVLIYRRGVRRTMGEVALQAQHATVLIAGADVGGSEAGARTFPYALPMAIALGIAVLFPRVLTAP